MSQRNGKKMRVAAIFTGAAAVVTAFTPALAGTAKASSLRERPCTASRKTWLHLAHGMGASTYITCWGYKGGYTFDSLQSTFAVCGGENYGFLDWYAPGYDSEKTVDFRQATNYAYWPAGTDFTTIYAVHISGWAGADACPGSGN